MKLYDTVAAEVALKLYKHYKESHCIAINGKEYPKSSMLTIDSVGVDGELFEYSTRLSTDGSVYIITLLEYDGNRNGEDRYMLSAKVCDLEEAKIWMLAHCCDWEELYELNEYHKYKDMLDQLIEELEAYDETHSYSDPIPKYTFCFKSRLGWLYDCDTELRETALEMKDVKAKYDFLKANFDLHLKFIDEANQMNPRRRYESFGVYWTIDMLKHALWSLDETMLDRLAMETFDRYISCFPMKLFADCKMLMAYYKKYYDSLELGKTYKQIDEKVRFAELMADFIYPRHAEYFPVEEYEIADLSNLLRQWGRYELVSREKIKNRVYVTRWK